MCPPSPQIPYHLRLPCLLFSLISCILYVPDSSVSHFSWLWAILTHPYMQGSLFSACRGVAVGSRVRTVWVCRAPGPGREDLPEIKARARCWHGAQEEFPRTAFASPLGLLRGWGLLALHMLGAAQFCDHRGKAGAAEAAQDAGTQVLASSSLHVPASPVPGDVWLGLLHWSPAVLRQDGMVENSVKGNRTQYPALPLV